MPEEQQSPRRRRRATGPPGSVRVGDEPLPAVREAASEPSAEPADDERLSADRPPHHDRGV